MSIHYVFGSLVYLRFLLLTRHHHGSLHGVLPNQQQNWLSQSVICYYLISQVMYEQGVSKTTEFSASPDGMALHPFLFGNVSVLDLR